MRPLEDREFDDLQLLIRAFGAEYGLRYKRFAVLVGEYVEKEARESGLGIEDAAVAAKRADAESSVQRFLSSISNGGIQVLAPAMGAVLSDLASDKHDENAEMYHDIIKRFLEGNGYVTGTAGFLGPRRKHMTPGRQSRIAQHRGDKVLTTVLGRSLSLLTADHSNDVSAMDERIGESRFVCIRPSSTQRLSFTVHGLRFSPHHSDLGVYYFSEKYFSPGDPGTDRKSRKSQGTCFIDNGILTGLARAEYGPGFTYLLGKLPSMMQNDQPLTSFKATIASTNFEGEAVGATALCLRCDSKEDKYARIGTFEKDRLMELFDAEQGELIMEWMHGMRKIRGGFVIL